MRSLYMLLSFIMLASCNDSQLTERKNALFQEGDLIRTQETKMEFQSESLQIGLGPQTEIISGDQSLKVSEGLVRVNSRMPEYQVQGPEVAFLVKGQADWEVKVSEDVVEVDVHTGEVEATSPHVHTFVPWIIKAKEGFRYSRKTPAFEQKDFNPGYGNFDKE